MEKLKFKMNISIILVVSIIFTTICPYFMNSVLATSGTPTSTELTEEQIRAEIDAWANETVSAEKLNITKYKYEQDGEIQYTYAASLPKLNNSKYPNITYDSTAKRYVYNVKNADGNVYKTIYFNVSLVSSPDVGVTAENYSEYKLPQQNDVLQQKDDDLLKVLYIESDESVNIAYAIEFENGMEPLFSASAEVDPEEEEKNLWELLVDAVGAVLGTVLDWVGNVLTGILNRVLLLIAEGIQNLIKGIFGSDEVITIYQIVFGKIDKLSINYWDTATIGNVTEENPDGIVDNSPAPTLKPIVSHWYGVLKGIGMAIYLLMLLYIGVRILLASTGKSSEQYKELLKSWVVGVIILVFFPYVMRYTVVVNDILVEMIDTETGSNQSDIMTDIWEEAEEKNNIALTIVYIVMLGQIIVLLGVYYKRVFMMAFLITIFPIVAVLYIWEKTSGGAKALSTWTKEYVVLVLTQTFHAVIYVVLIEGAYFAYQTSKNWVIFILSVTFLFEAEKIIRSIFGMKSSANTIGNLASAGAAAWGTAQAVNKVFGKDDKKAKTQDEKDVDALDDEVEENKKNVAINNTLNATYGPPPGIGGSGSGGSGGGSSGGGPGGGGSGGSAPIVPGVDTENIRAGQALVNREALKPKTKRGILAKAINATTKTAGVTLGITSGLAAGDMKEGFSNAAVGYMAGGMIGNMAGSITGYAKGAFAGKTLKRRIRAGKMDDELKKVGLDLSAMDTAKAKVIRNALAAGADATRRAGLAAGELTFVKTVEKGRKEEGI